MVLLKYQMTLLVTAQWLEVRLCRNWHKWLIENVMSSPVNVQYCKAPTKGWYSAGLLKGFSSYWDTFDLVGSRVFVGFASTIRSQSSISVIYLDWERCKPIALWWTWMPKKKYRVPRSFIAKLWCKHEMSSIITNGLFLVRMMSST